MNPSSRVHTVRGGSFASAVLRTEALRQGTKKGRR